MIKVLIHNIKIDLNFKDENDRTIKYITQGIHEQLDPLDPDRYRKKLFNTYNKYGQRIWDGRIKICTFNPKKGIYQVPTGLYPDLIDYLTVQKDKTGIEFSVKDQRGPKLTANIPDEITLDGHRLEKTLTLRDYQYDGVKGSLEEQVGILLNSTNSGKTSIAISIFKYLLPKLEEGQHLLFIAPRNSIMNQLLLKFQHYLGEDLIGVWGDGNKDLDHPIVCATIQTIASAIKKPDIKVTSKKDKLLERMATKYVPAILESGSPTANLKLLALNFKPNYKYEEDDLDLFRELSMTLETDKDAIKCLEGYVKKYKKVMYKKNEKGFKKYDSAIEFLNSVVGVICDEAHFAGADSYWNVFQHLTNARLRIGMTGTLDKTKPIHMQRIKSLLGTPITRVTNDQMIKRGVSAKPHIRMVPVDKPANLEMQIGAIAKQQGIGGGSAADLMMYQIAYKLGVVENEYRNSLIARLADASAKQLDKQAVLLIVNSIEHGENICKELDKLGAEYLFIQGKDDNDTRKEALARVKSGDLKILIGTKIIDTGIDVPNFKVLIMCSSGKSYISLLQRVGRVLRIMPEKKDVIIFDMYDRTTDILFRHAKQRIKYYKEQGFDVK